MHPAISIAVPTRHRTAKLNNFLSSLIQTVPDPNNCPHITIIHDAPTDPTELTFTSLMNGPALNIIRNQHKRSLAALWNQCLIEAPSDWVLICNDDAYFKNGWLEYLENQVASNKFKQINLLNYGGMCVHKSFILDIGWYDENFEGGGYEDVEAQLRISEAGLKDFVDMSHDFIFLEHRKDSSDCQDWAGENNSIYIVEKWGRNQAFDNPCQRKLQEIDWHPMWTRRYEKKFNKKACFVERYLDLNYIGKWVRP